MAKRHHATEQGFAPVWIRCLPVPLTPVDTVAFVPAGDRQRVVRVGSLLILLARARLGLR